MAAPRPGNTDRGWNDPPMFDYHGSVATTGSPQHNKLNKRVAYPMSATTTSSSTATTGTSPLLNPSDGPPRLPPVHILPPSSTTTTPTPVPLLIPSLSPAADTAKDQGSGPTIFSPPAAGGSGSVPPVGGASTDVKVKDMESLLLDLSLGSDEELLQYVKDGLKSAAESVKDSIQGRAMEDVKKKLELMKECWTSGKISQPVKSQMGSLVEALNKQHIDGAHEVHLALMINHTAEVNQWLVAVKRIIQELRNKQPDSQASQDEGQAAASVTDPCLNMLNFSPEPLKTDVQSAETSAPAATSVSDAEPEASAEGNS